MRMLMKIFNIKSIGLDFLEEFLEDIAIINYIRARIFLGVFLFLHILLLYEDYNNWQKGLWSTSSYKLLFYSHLLLVLTLPIMILVSQFIKQNDKRNIYFKGLFSLFFVYYTLFFSAWVSGFIDQRLHQQVTVYVMNILMIAVVIYLKPITSMIVYVSSFAFFTTGLVMNQTNNVIFKANLVNCGIILIVGWSVSVILYSMRVQEFVSQKTIEAQNKMLKDSLEALDESQNLILSLNAALESKDAYTGGHSERVAKYAVELAKYMGLSEADQVLLLRAATLHDIGKIGIPDAILNKSGSLSQDEWLVMCSHPEKSESICSKLKFTHDALPIIRHHHEKYDGTGYPDRLKGDQIPYLARIVSIADAVDAITSNRSYRPARPMQVALEELKRGSGTQFDPELVNAFLNLQQVKQQEDCVI